VQNRLVAIAFVVAGVAGCAQAQTTPLKAARLTIDGATHMTRPPAFAAKSSRTEPLTSVTTTARLRRWCG
jgi:hypothetical protein